MNKQPANLHKLYMSMEKKLILSNASLTTQFMRPKIKFNYLFKMYRTTINQFSYLCERSSDRFIALQVGHQDLATHCDRIKLNTII